MRHNVQNEGEGGRGAARALCANSSLAPAKLVLLAKLHGSAADVILKVSRGNKGAVGIDAGRADLRPVLPNFIWRGNL